MATSNNRSRSQSSLLDRAFSLFKGNNATRYSSASTHSTQNSRSRTSPTGESSPPTSLSSNEGDIQHSPKVPTLAAKQGSNSRTRHNFFQRLSRGRDKKRTDFAGQHASNQERAAKIATALARWREPTTEELRAVVVDINTIFTTPRCREMPIPLIDPLNLDPVLEEPKLSIEQAFLHIEIMREQVQLSRLDFKRAIVMHFTSACAGAKQHLEALTQLDRALCSLHRKGVSGEECVLESLEQLDRDLGLALQEGDRITRSLRGCTVKSGELKGKPRETRRAIIELGPLMLKLADRLLELRTGVEGMIQR